MLGLGQILAASVLLPLAVACTAIWLGRRLGLGPAAAVLGLLAGYGAGHLAALGLPPLPPHSLRDKLPLVAALASLGALAAPAWWPILRRRRILCASLLGGMVLGLALPALASGSLAPATLLAPLAAALLLAAADGAARSPGRHALGLLAAALGLALLAALVRTGSLAQLALTVAALLAGLRLAKPPWPAAALLVPQALLLGLACGLAWFTPAGPAALLLLLPAVLADRLAGTGSTPSPSDDRPPARLALAGLLLPLPLAAALAGLQA